MGNEKDDVIVRMNWLSKNFANKKKIWVKRSKKDFADKVFSICTDALGLLIEQKAEIKRLKSTLGTVITASSITLTATGDAKQGEKRGLEFGKAYMKEHIEKELLYKHLLTDEIKEIIERTN